MPTMSEELQYDPLTEYSFKGTEKRGPSGEVATLTHMKESMASDGIGKYFTKRWSDGMLSCDCRGWTIRKFEKHRDSAGKKIPKPRECKHTKASVKCDCSDMTPVATFQSQQPAVYQEALMTPSERKSAGIRIRDRNRGSDS